MPAKTPAVTEASETGLYALRVATLYAFGAFAVLAGVALLLQFFAFRVGPSLAPALVLYSGSLTADSHACLIGFLTLGTISWNFSCLDSLRHRGSSGSALRPLRVPTPTSPDLASGSRRGFFSEGQALGINPYSPERWVRS